MGPTYQWRNVDSSFPVRTDKELNAAATSDEIENEYRQGNHQESVDECTANMRHQTYNPKQ
jgi:hypothetical protein